MINMRLISFSKDLINLINMRLILIIRSGEGDINHIRNNITVKVGY